MATGGWAGQAGTITITQPDPNKVLLVTSNVILAGNWILTQDDTPNTGGWQPLFWDSTWGLATYAEMRLSIDGGPSSIRDYMRKVGELAEFSNIWFNTSGLDPNWEHTATLFFQDVYGYGNPPSLFFTRGVEFGHTSIRFRICANVDNDPFSTCDGDTKTNGCDDNDPTIYPGAPELCDKKDNNCNGVVDEGCDPCAGNPCCEDPDPCKCGASSGTGTESGSGTGY